MLKNYISLFRRNLVRQKGFSTINLLGLALGFACFTLISVYLSYESRFDAFHPGVDRLYRINKVVTTPTGQTEKHALTAGLLAPALTETFPEVEAVTRVQPWFDEVLLSRGDAAFMTPDVTIADSNFFDVFGFELLRGRPDRVLTSPLSMVLTASVARRLFGDDDPMGQTVQGLENLDYVITGIAADPNPQSHLRFSALISWTSTLPGAGGLEFDWLNRWITQAPFTYVRLARASSADAFESKLPDFYAARDPERAARYRLYLQPIREAYLDSGDLLYADASNRGSARSVATFAVLRFLILVIAAINFMNLSTARTSSRSREIGVRKALGAGRTILTRQFLLESIAYSVLAFGIATLLSLAAKPVLASFSGVAAFRNGSIGWPLLLSGLGFAVALGLLSGMYPAAVLSRLNPSRQIRRSASTHSSYLARNLSVLVQFSVSMVLVSGTLVVLRQMQFVQTVDAGYNPEQLVVLQTDDTAIQGRFEAFVQELLKDPSILGAAGSNSVPGSATMTFNVAPDGQETDDAPTANIVRVDDYALRDTYEFTMVRGRFFQEDHPIDATNGIVINEALMNALGWEDPVGRRLDIPGELENGRVIGVVKDFHFQSMHQAIAPLAFYFAPRGEFLTVRIAAASTKEALDHMERVWKSFEPLYPFSYSFLDQSFARFYTNEARLMKLLSLFAGLALFIACMGLYGLAAFMTGARTREIGIRKVLGAGVARIVLLFVTDLLKLVGVAIVIGAPIAFFGSRKWLENFAYRATMGIDLYLAAAIIVLLIALLSVSYQPIRAALSNPVRALRQE